MIDIIFTKLVLLFAFLGFVGTMVGFGVWLLMKINEKK